MLRKKLREAAASTLPIVILATALHLTIAPVPWPAFALFLLCAVGLIGGMSLFTLGAEMSMMPMGEMSGAHMTRSRNLPLICAVGFIMGVLVTVAEPDLQVLAETVPAFPTRTLIYSVAAGVGAFMTLALLRIVFQIRLNWLLTGLYALLFLLALLTEKGFLPVAFDAGGVTTGPITVPFILALGIGVSAVRGGRSAQEDSFGLVALCSVGPILAVMTLSFLYDPGTSSYAAETSQLIGSVKEIPAALTTNLGVYAREVAVALLPIIAFFALFQVLFLKLPRQRLIPLGVGLVYTALGLMIFLTCVNAGFMPVGYAMGGALAAREQKWIIVPVGMLMGYFIVRAEPAVHVLNAQVEQITDGAIRRRSMLCALSVGIAASVGISMLRLLTGMSILWFLAPGYALAVMLSFFVPGIFTAVAFDSGGVASGPMTATFLLPFAMGACDQLGRNVMSDAFGIVAMVAMTPLIAVQVMAFLYSRRPGKATEPPAGSDGDIIDFE